MRIIATALFVGILAVVVYLATEQSQEVSVSQHISLAIADVDWLQKWPIVRADLTRRVPSSKTGWIDVSSASKLPQAMSRDLGFHVWYMPIQSGNTIHGIYVEIGENAYVNTVVLWNFPQNGMVTSIEDVQASRQGGLKKE